MRLTSSAADACNSGSSRHPEQVIDRWRSFGYAPPEGKTDADMARRHIEVLFKVLRGEGFARPNPRSMFPNPPGLLRVEPHSDGLRDRIWWGAASNATAAWGAKLGMNLQSSTLKYDETGQPFHVQQAEQIRTFRAAWKEAGHSANRACRSAEASSPWWTTGTMPISGGRRDAYQIGFLATTRAPFLAAATPPTGRLVEELAKDEAIAEADTLLLTVPNQLGVDYNAHVIEAILKHVAPALDGAEALGPVHFGWDTTSG